MPARDGPPQTAEDDVRSICCVAIVLLVLPSGVSCPRPECGAYGLTGGRVTARASALFMPDVSEGPLWSTALEWTSPRTNFHEIVSEVR